MLLRDGWDDDGRMEADKRFAQGIEVGIPSGHLNVLFVRQLDVSEQCGLSYSCTYAVFNVVSMRSLSGVNYEYFEVRVLVEDLLDSAIIATFPRKLTRLLLLAVFRFIIVT